MIAPAVSRRRPGAIVTALALSGAACLLDRRRDDVAEAHVTELDPWNEEELHGLLR